mmetsp:Transcript_25420/g.28230  ORF Transcript_25420/g.28230 Transcript_25420/m.28230 type:complete len:151 (+) Transcript_25420:200-652(+)
MLHHHSPKAGTKQVPLIITLLYLSSILLTVIISQSCKYFFGRDRPSVINTDQKFNLRKLEGNCSMPSGDTAQAANWSVFMSINFTLRGSLSESIFLLAWLPSAFARIYFQCHWIGDTIVGAFIGIGVALLIDSIKHHLIELIILILNYFY